MIKLTINAQTRQTQCRLISEVLTEFDAKPPFAVALNGEFVPRGDYQRQTVKEGDQIDIVAPIFGG